MDLKILSKKAKTILLEKEWGTGILLPLYIGAIVFFLIMLLNGKLQNSLFWGIFSTYMLFGGFFSTSKNAGKIAFETVNVLIGIAAIIAGVLGLIFWPEIKILGWPTALAGLLLMIFSGLGMIAKAMARQDSYPY